MICQDEQIEGGFVRGW